MAQVPVTLGGGTLLRNGAGISLGAGTAVGVGTLTLTATSILDFGTTAAGTLNINGFAPNGSLLTITDYTRTTSPAMAWIDGTDDRLIFNQQLSTVQLADINFSGLGATELLLGNGEFEVVPVPEPTTVLGSLMTFGLLRVSQRQRVASWAAASAGMRPCPVDCGNFSRSSRREDLTIYAF